MTLSIKTSELFSSHPKYLTSLFEECEYPWQLLPRIKGFFSSLFDTQPEGFTLLRDGIYVGSDVQIHPSAVIEGPALIGSGTQIRPGAFLRGNVIIGDNCVVGNSTELKNCILLSDVQVPHYNYVGDSVLGNHSHMGAGSICSNLKSDHKNVVIHADREYETGMRKIGGILADGADIGCGCVLNPGTVIGRNTSVYPLTLLRGVYPPNSIVKSTKTVVERI